VAVLPFADLSHNKDQEYFCDGMTDDIITKLSRLGELKVISRTSVMRFKNTEKDIREVGQELNVATVLEGSIRKAGENIRVNAQLIDVEDGFTLWADSYDRELKDIFAVQSDIGEKISDALKAKLSPADKKEIKKKPTLNLEAYNLYLKGNYFFQKATTESIQKSIEYFHEAIKKDPEFALAHTGIANYYNFLGYYDYLSPKETFPRAMEAVEKALKIDENTGEAHSALAATKLLYEWNWEEAEKESLRAIELSPGYAWSYSWYSHLLAITGRFTEAIREAKKVTKLDPFSVRVNLVPGGMFYMSRQFEKAIEAHNRAVEIEPNSPFPYFFLAYAYAAASRYENALEAAEKALKLSGGKHPVMIATMGYIYALLGKRNEAESVLKELSGLPKKSYIPPHAVASIHLELGRIDETFKWLEKAYEVRDHWMYLFKIHPMWDSIRPDPRYKALLKKMGLE
jgi:TolB-like protein/Flp pilus assembly protein TadD